MPKDNSKVKDFIIEPGSVKKNEKEITSQDASRAFAKIYTDQRDYDFPRSLKVARKKKIWTVIISVLMMMFVIALFFLFFFNSNNRKFGEESFNLTFTGPKQAPSGQMVEYIIAYHNDQGVDLNNVEINLRYPSGFTFEGSLPQAENNEGTKLLIKKIRGRESGNLSVRGLLVGEVGESKNFTVIVTYEPENINAQYARTLNFSTELVASVLNLELSGPTQLPVAESFNLTATYRNSSVQSLNGLVIRLIAPSGFELELPSLSALSGANNTWLLPELAPLMEAKVEFRGRFTDLVSPDKQVIKVAVGILNDAGDITIQEEKIHEINLVKTHLTLNLTANDVSLRSALDLGQQVTYQVTIANEGETPFTDVRLIARLDTKYLDWSTLRDDAGGTINRSQGTITWTKDSLPFLTSLAPGSRTTIRWYLAVQPLLPPEINPPFSFSAQVEAFANQQVGDNIQSITAQSNEVISRINTRFTLETDGRYYTDELIKLGSGPLPPQVNQTTTYVIFWRLSNTINEVENVVVTTTLPPDVNFTGHSTVTAGSAVTFNPNTREVRWTLNRLPGGAGSSFAKPEASFEVAITPVPSDAHKILVLTRTTTATARDSVSGADLISTAKFITTEIDNDLGAQGKGIVIP